MNGYRKAILISMTLVFEFVYGSGTSSISGRITGPNDEPLSYMPIQIIHLQSGHISQSRSSPEGVYEITELNGGEYSLSIATQCCAYAGFSEDKLLLVEDKPLVFNIRMKEGVSLSTLGDDPITIANLVRDRQIIPDLPVPQTAEGKPDLSGVWLVNSDPFPQQAQAQLWAENVKAERIKNQMRNHPHNSCLPGDLPIPSGGSPFIGKFVQTASLVVILLEDVPGYRQIFLDGRKHPADPNPSWMGHSIAHWDGDTLVVDTVGFNDRGWTNMYPRSEELHMTERYRRTVYGHMIAQITLEDTAVFTAPLVMNMSFDLAPQEELIEYVCENNKWAPE